MEEEVVEWREGENDGGRSAAPHPFLPSSLGGRGHRPQDPVMATSSISMVSGIGIKVLVKVGDALTRCFSTPVWHHESSSR